MSGRKYLCHANEDTELQAIVADLDTEMADKKNQIEFLLKRASQLSDEAKAVHKKHWSRIEVRLRGLAKLPADYSEDTHLIVYDEKDGVFYWDRRQEHPLMSFLSGLKL